VDYSNQVRRLQLLLMPAFVVYFLQDLCCLGTDPSIWWRAQGLQYMADGTSCMPLHIGVLWSACQDQLTLSLACQDQLTCYQCCQLTWPAW